MVDQANSGGAWLQDPSGRFSQRWWNGLAWTDQVATADGAVHVDALNIAADSTAIHAASQLPPPIIQNQFQGYQPAGPQTPSFNLPGGGAWAQPQQIVVTDASKSPGTAIASLILGVGAFFFALIPVFGLTSVPFAIVGLGMGISAWIRANKGFEGKGMAVVGVAACVAALFVSVAYIVAIGNEVENSPTINSDEWDGICNPNRYYQDPDC